MKNFIKSYCLVLNMLLLSFCSNSLAQQMPSLGIVSPLSRDSIIHSAGFKYIGESVSNMLSPSLSEEALEANLKRIKAAKTKVLSCNIFFPGNIKIAGPEVNTEQVLTYAEKVLSRANKAGVKYVILGSSSARSIPQDYDKDKAKSDFVKICSELAKLAYKNKVIIALENLQSSETNFINTVKDAADVVRKVNNPAFGLNADIFHMMRENESPEEIVKAGNLLVFCEVAEKEKRSLPGVMKEDFKPYFEALKQLKYNKYIFIEGKIENAETEIPYAFSYLTQQIKEVYGKK
ncbi:sugar phosphate isomerase/epimerase [Pedobacter aquatilis]|uniref:sugar phosphate isomerase/epimerase family protein n=1 Tax=Pedobacter aquatilis TaxID=351343 RepID=UPI0025B592A4|nr:sugar phosphate isomerase/epimerase [Pedobacter aquatilis]MDN3585277.1 sugar phosphate isomerase/epimerase [Pedobacter aquatilis]